MDKNFLTPRFVQDLALGAFGIGLAMQLQLPIIANCILLYFTTPFGIYMLNFCSTQKASILQKFSALCFIVLYSYCAWDLYFKLIEAFNWALSVQSFRYILA